jgi:O-antigen/teichoic acid export membrane protein
MLIDLLFKNLGVRQTIFKNTFWLAAAEVISRFLKFILIVNVARVLGVTEYGKFIFALSFISTVVIFSDFGVSSITTRELSKGEESEDEYSAIFSLKMILGFGAFILIIIGSFFITQDPIIQKIIRILAIYAITLGFSEIIYAFLRARQIMEYEALARVIQAVLVTGVGLFVISKFASVENLSLSYLFGGLFASIIVLFYFHFKIRPLKFSCQKSVWRKIFSMSWPLGLGTVFGSVSAVIGLLIMGYLNLITEVGLYGAAGKIVNVLFLPLAIIAQSFYPMLNKSFKKSKEVLQKVWNYQIELRMFILAPLVAGMIVLAPRIINLVYGSDFILSALVLQILIPGIGLIYFSGIFSQILVVINEQRKAVMVAFCGSIIAIILNLILIPKFSFYGVALCVFIVAIFNFLLLFRFTLKFAPLKPLSFKIVLNSIGYIFASILMFFVLSFPKIYNLNIFISILVGGLTYLTTVFIYKKITKSIFIDIYS